MAAGTSPIFPRTPDVQWSVAVTAANTAKDGTGTVTTIFTADTDEGGPVDRIICVPAGTNVQTVVRVFVNNGLTNATAANNAMIDQWTLPATTNTETAALPRIEIPLNVKLMADHKINVTLGTAVSAGWIFTALGGKY